MVRLGTEYGGWEVDLDSIPTGATILDVGVGADISFAKELYDIKKTVTVFVDPSRESKGLVNSQRCNDFKFIQAAVSVDSSILPWHNHVGSGGSGSLCMENVNVNRRASGHIQCVSLASLIKEFSPCMVKLDIEGEEYAVYRDCVGVKQVAIEFHHRFMRLKTESDTRAAINHFVSHGYHVIATGVHDEYTFLLRENGQP